MLIFFLLLLLIPCFTIKKKEEDDTNILDSKSTTCLKGVICLFVMFHNLGLDYKGNSAITELICEHAGGVGVGLFFFLSAFGIVRSYQKNGNKYLLKLIFVNIVKLYIISVCINLLSYFVFFKDSFTQTDALMRIFNLDVFNDFNRMNRHGWYIPTIIGMYLIFALIYYLFSKLKTKNKFIIAGIVLSVIAVMFRVCAIIADKGGMYTREIPAFATGVIYATFFDQINSFIKKNYKITIIMSFVLMWVGFFTYEPLSTHSSIIFIISVSHKVNYHNDITFFLGKICIYVYLLLHFSSLVLQEYLVHEYLWMILNAGLILGLSLIAYLIQILIEKGIKSIINLFRKNKIY